MIFIGGIILLLSLANGVRSEALDQSKYDSCVRRTDGLVCYKTFDTPDLWAVADGVCNAQDMTMLDILTAAENGAVVDLLTRKNMVDSWTAAMQSSDSWRWLDDVELSDQGCFVDNGTTPDMEYMMDFPLNNSVTNCIAHCRDLFYSYAGVEAGTQCHCGDTFGRYGQEGANCGIQCPGNASESCGGNLPMSQQVYAVNGAPTIWLGGQPNDDKGYQTCAIADSSTGYRWQDVFCRDGYRAICEIPLTNNNCSNSRASLVNGRCLMLTDQEANYFDSRFTCRSFGGDLVIHLTPADTLSISTWLNVQSSPSSVQLYIGLIKWQWTWQTGSEFLYTNWKNDQPTGPNFNCITVEQATNPGQWIAGSCNASHLYVCQKSNATLKVTAPLFTLPPTTTQRRTAPPPLPPTPTRGGSSLPSTPRSPLDPNQPPSDKSSSSNSTARSVNAAIIGGAVAGGVVLLIVICVVVVIIAVGGSTCCCCCCCCARPREATKEKGGISGAESTTTPAPPSYFFGIETTPKYRNGGEQYSHPSIPNFDVEKGGAAMGRDGNSPTTPDVVPAYPYPMATPYDNVTDARTQPNPYTSEIFIKPELSY